MSNNSSDFGTTSYNGLNESNYSLPQFSNPASGCAERPSSFHWSELYIHERPKIYFIGFTLIAIVSFLSNILTIQTVLCCRDIRITNLGVYLVLFSICSFCLAAFQAVWIDLIFVYGEDHVPKDTCFALVLLISTLCYLCAMFWASAGIERALIQCCDTYSLFDSRRRSIFFTCIIFFLVLIYVFTGIVSRQYSLIDIVKCDRHDTKAWLIISTVSDCVYDGGSLIVLVLTNLFVLKHLSKRRNYLLANAVTDADTIYETTFKMWLKHRDFYFSPLIYPLAMLPRYFFRTFLNCDAVAKNGPLAWLDVSTTLLAYSANTFTFFMYIWPSTVYMKKFWQRSIVGLLLIMMNKKCRRLIDYCRG
jgi:hypothetical protein